MNISKDTFNDFHVKYIQLIYNIFKLKGTNDSDLGIFSWRYDEKNPNNKSELDNHILFLLDDKMNKLKTHCLIFINYSFNKSKRTIKDKTIIEIINELIPLGWEFINHVILFKTQIIQYFDLEDDGWGNGNREVMMKSQYYENLIYQYLVFFANVINTSPFKEKFFGSFEEKIK